MFDALLQDIHQESCSEWQLFLVRYQVRRPKKNITRLDGFESIERRDRDGLFRGMFDWYPCKDVCVGSDGEGSSINVGWFPLILLTTHSIEAVWEFPAYLLSVLRYTLHVRCKQKEERFLLGNPYRLAFDIWDCNLCLFSFGSCCPCSEILSFFQGKLKLFDVDRFNCCRLYAAL